MDIIVANEQGRAPVTVFCFKGEIGAKNYERPQTQAWQAFEASMRNLLL